MQRKQHIAAACRRSGARLQALRAHSIGRTPIATVRRTVNCKVVQASIGAVLQSRLPRLAVKQPQLLQPEMIRGSRSTAKQLAAGLRGFASSKKVG